MSSTQFQEESLIELLKRVEQFLSNKTLVTTTIVNNGKTFQVIIFYR